MQHFKFLPFTAKSRARSAGFTLIELMIAVAIMGILISIAAPSMRDMLINNRVQGVSSDLVADLSLARGTAAAKGQRVTICQSTDSATCTGGSTWQGGWIVFVDGNSNGTFEPASDTLVKAREATNTNLTVAPYNASSTALTSANTSTTSVRLRPSGTTTVSAAIGFRICQSGFVYRDVLISTLGRVSSSTSSARATSQNTTSCS